MLHYVYQPVVNFVHLLVVEVGLSENLFAENTWQQG